MKLRSIIFPATLLFAIAICFSCECEQERLKRLLTDPNDPLAYKSWSISVLYKGGDTMNFTKKHVLLFQGNGVFEACFYHGKHIGFDVHDSKRGSKGLLASDVIAPPMPHNWQFGKPGTLILQGDTVILEKITRDSLIFKNYPVENGRAIYLLKRDHSDIAFDSHEPHKG